MSLIDTLTSEGLFPATRKAREVNRHPSWLLRCILCGVKLADGQRLRLEAIRVGGTWFTSEAAWRRFLEAQQPAESQERPTLRSPAERQRASEAAERELVAAGC